ncbi:MAG: uroporphyrinogen-III synthase [Comamonadaceae bacterium]|nr:MAG: uroporphyrinogen-III synthase [Comamonadaceae bacterium]
MSLRVIVTRPQDEAAVWLERLRAAGHDGRSLPLIAIEPGGPAVQAALRRARAELGTYRAAMFVSGSAARAFFGIEGAAAVGLGIDADGAADPRCWATGPGTVQALRAVGVDPRRIDAPLESASTFDSEALWSRVGDGLRVGDRVLLVRGGDSDGRPTGRDWLARRIDAAGGRSEEVVAYRRTVPAFDAADLALAQASAADGSVWLFSSSEAVGHLRAWLPETDWHAARAVATHERIAQAARDAGFGAVRASSPRLEDLIASIESFR